MRTFVAVFPPPAIREALLRAARDLPASKAFRLIGPEKLHLTLKFLGNVAEDDLSRVAQALEPLRQRHEPFEVSISGFGAFPSERKARILWAGVGEGSEPLRAVALSVEDLLEPAGFGREQRPYVPHLTLGRARGRQAKLDGASVSPPALRFTLSSVDLVESVPGEGEVTYSVLETYSF
ncbi:MAG TPA: RNA 2',3'-cyclic phosphodiesterase [Rubrobacter sp.]|nr:RNA 2',3'-cyclic phosphodiesterase [Rubrobacter sp.]